MARARRRTGPPLRVALTGGVASGKTTVAKLFGTLGAGIIDTDQIARDIVAPGAPALALIAERFGAQVMAADGTLDRARLREQVFRDPQARRDLEAITHPRIREEVARRSQRAREPYLVIAIPLLAETGTAGEYDRVLLVDCEERAQRLRLMQRDGVDAAAAERMLAAQASREARRAIADDIIVNDGDVSHLARAVETLHRGYLRRAGYAK